MACTDPPVAAVDPAPAACADILVIAAHPELEQSRVNRRLLQAARGAGERRAGRLDVRDLYALYPDYLIDVERRAGGARRAPGWSSGSTRCTGTACRRC